MKKLILIFSLYYIGVWVSHLSLLSLISFFHFLLDHRLSVVESWVFERGWTLTFWSKFISFYILSHFIDDGSLFSKKNLQKKFSLAYSRAWSFSLAGLFLICIFGALKGNVDFKGLGFSNLQALLGFPLYLLMDVLVLDMIEKKNLTFSVPEKLLRVVFVFSVALASTYLIFLYAKNHNAFFIYSFFMTFVVYYWRKRVRDAFVLVLTSLLPVSVLLGEDFIWGSVHSPYLLTYEKTQTIFIALALMGLIMAFKRGVRQS